AMRRRLAEPGRARGLAQRLGPAVHAHRHQAERIEPRGEHAHVERRRGFFGHAREVEHDRVEIERWFRAVARLEGLQQPSRVAGVCAFASGFALRIIDPLVAPIAHHYGVAPTVAAMLTTAYAIPYAIAQPFLGPIGDRFGKARCIQACVAGLALALVLGTLAPTFALLVASRVVA